MLRQLFLSILVLFSATANAKITLPKCISSHAVLQRNQPLKIWGWANPNEVVTITFLGEKQALKANAKGDWSFHFAPQPAGGPHEMTIEGENKIVLTDLLFGDVWLCSGQSNMEWPVAQSNNADLEIAAANYPNIRLFSVPNRMAFSPEADLEAGAWQLCTPETIADFSAVGYFFGKNLQPEIDVPIGLINSTWGGTVVETWTSKQAFLADPNTKKEKAILQNVDLEIEFKKLEGAYDKWLESFTTDDKGIRDGEYVWAKPDDESVEWRGLPVPSLWENAGVAQLENLDGVVWLRKEFELTAEQANANATLFLGAIDDSDITFINGQKVGETYQQYQTMRQYPVAANALTVGENTLIIRVEDYIGGGGLYSPRRAIFLETTTKDIPLSGKWQYRIGCKKPLEGRPKVQGPNAFPSLLFNGMIHPLLNYKIKGAIWYQGESNAGDAVAYRKLFPLLIRDWRRQWGIGNFPFIWVQLANWQKPPRSPNDPSNWALLREAQDMTLKLPNTAQAIAIDIGEADDIHPRNKQEVGRRLALAARKVAYEEVLTFSGPRIRSFEVKEGAIYITFNSVASGLIPKDKYGYIRGFTIAGENRFFRWAKAELIDEKTIKVYNRIIDNPVAVRYAWADNPDDVNLYNSEGLPACPFRTDDW